MRKILMGMMGMMLITPMLANASGGAWIDITAIESGQGILIRMAVRFSEGTNDTVDTVGNATVNIYDKRGGDLIYSSVEPIHSYQWYESRLGYTTVELPWIAYADMDKQVKYMLVKVTYDQKHKDKSSYSDQDTVIRTDM